LGIDSIPKTLDLGFLKSSRSTERTKNGKEVFMEQMIGGYFDTHELAEKAVRALGEAGTPLTNVSIIAQNLQTTEQVQGFITTGDAAQDGAGVGAWWGGIFGVLIGSAFLWIPGLGPLIVAGTLALSFVGMLEGAMVCAVSGGLIGALIGGLSKDKALRYETFVRMGSYLVLSHGNEDQISIARDVLKVQSARDIEVLREKQWSLKPV
jgi:hypothetical protein